MNTNKIATRNLNRKLLAALAVLAVAFVVLAAVPAVADESDATDPTVQKVYVSQDGTADLASATSAESPAAIETVFSGTDNALNTTIAAGSTITIVGEVSSLRSTLLNVDKAVTIQGQAASDGTAAALDGYRLALNTTGAGTYTIRNLTITAEIDSSIGGSVQSAVIYSSNSVKGDSSIVLNNVDIQASGVSRQNYEDNKNSSVVSIWHEGTVEIRNSTIAWSGTATTKVHGLEIADVKTVTLIGNTITGVNRAINLDQISGTASVTGNTITLSKNGTLVGKALNIGFNNTSKQTGAAFTVTGNTISLPSSGTSYAVCLDDSLDAIKSLTTDSDTVVLMDSEALTVSGTLNVKSGATLKIQTGATLKVDGTSEAKAVLDIDGSVEVAEGGNLLSGTNGSIALASGAQLTLRADYDGVEPVVFTGKAESVLTSSKDNDVWSLGQTSGSVELTQGTLPVAGSLTLTDGTFTVAQDAAIDASASSTGLVLNGGTLDVYGQIVTKTINAGSATKAASIVLESESYLKLPNSSTITLAASGVTATLTQRDGAVIGVEGTQSITALENKTVVALYAVGTGSDTYLSAISYAVEGETVDVAVAAESAKVVTGVSYKDSTNGSTKASVPLTKVSDTEYTFDMPAYPVTITRATASNITATFVLVYDDGKANETYRSVTVTATTTLPADPVREGYQFVGWYKDTTYSESVVDTDVSDLIASTTYYGRMLTTYAITVSTAGQGTAYSSPEAAIYNGSVSVTITAADGWVISKLTGYNGKEVSAAEGLSSYTYSFTMPAKAVTVSVVFVQQFTAKASTETVTGQQLAITMTGGSTTNGAASVTVGEGATVTLTVSPSNGYEVGNVLVKSTDGKTTLLQLGSGVKAKAGSANTYTFAMPGQDVVVSATYGAIVSVDLSITDASTEVTGATLDFGGKDITLSSSSTTVSVLTGSGTTAVEGTASAAANAKVVLTFTPAKKGYAVSSLKINGGSDDLFASVTYDSKGIGTYTYTVPSSGTASVAVTFGPVFEVSDVKQAGTGNVIVPDVLSGVAGTQIQFRVLAADGAQLQKIEVYETYNNSSSTPTDTYEVGKAYTASYWTHEDGSDIYTFVMPSANTARILFTFDDIVYYKIVVPDEGVKIYKTYNERTGALTDEVTDLDSVPYGVYYIEVTQIEGKDVNNASATYQNVITAASGSTAAVVETTKVAIKAYGDITAERAVYQLDLADAGYLGEAYSTGNVSKTVTVAAGYTDHQSVVTFEDPDNGSIAVTVDGTAIKSGDKVLYGKEIVVFVSIDASATGYIVKSVTANGEDLTATDNVYSVKVGMEDIAVAAELVQGYAITYGTASGVEISGPTGAAEKDTVTFTVDLDSAYTLDSLTIVYGDSQTAIDPTVSDDKRTYTFEMPAGAVTVTPKTTLTSDVPVAAKNVEIAIMGASNGTLSVILHSQDAGCYIPAGKVTVTFTYVNAIGLDATVTADAVAYAGTNTSAEYATVSVAIPSAVASAISSGNDVVAHATYAIDDGNSADSLIASLKEASA